MSFAQRLTFQQLHGNEGTLIVLVDIVNDADVGMIQCRGGACFPLKPIERRVILGVIVRQELEGNAAAQARIFRFVHHAHAAAPELFHDAVVGDCLPDHDLPRQNGDVLEEEFYLTARAVRQAGKPNRTTVTVKKVGPNSELL
jgi:hypothetical protein